jgi:DNA-binding IscR family transcriptional regulator
MLKLTKKADYGLIAMRHLALQGTAAAMATASAKDIADEYGIPQQALAKILQRSALEVIKAIDGPLFMTACSSDHDCVQSSKCTVREPLRKVSEKIQEALERVKLSDMGEEEPNAQAAAAPSIAELVRLT